MCVGELYRNITLYVLPEVSAVHVCITPHSINVTLIVKSSLDRSMPYTVIFGTTSCNALLLLLYLHELLADNSIIYTCILHVVYVQSMVSCSAIRMCMIHAGKDTHTIYMYCFSGLIPRPNNSRNT